MQRNWYETISEDFLWILFNKAHRLVFWNAFPHIFHFVQVSLWIPFEFRSNVWPKSYEKMRDFSKKSPFHIENMNARVASSGAGCWSRQRSVTPANSLAAFCARSHGKFCQPLICGFTRNRCNVEKVRKTAHGKWETGKQENSHSSHYHEQTIANIQWQFMVAEGSHFDENSLYSIKCVKFMALFSLFLQMMLQTVLAENAASILLIHL